MRSKRTVDSGVDNILFTNTDLALDHFISIFLEKIKEGKDIKNIVKEKRKAKGLTQQDLADAIGTSRQTVIQLENREYNPSLKLAFRIANILEIHIEDLFLISKDDLDPHQD
jgi:putative transcriptional regulator